jgi:hypothetical protein
MAAVKCFVWHGTGHSHHRDGQKGSLEYIKMITLCICDSEAPTFCHVLKKIKVCTLVVWLLLQKKANTAMCLHFAITIALMDSTALIFQMDIAP